MYLAVPSQSPSFFLVPQCPVIWTPQDLCKQYVTDGHLARFQFFPYGKEYFGTTILDKVYISL